MKKLTYGLDRHTITLRRVTIDGELNSSDREQYSVSVKKDLTPALSALECSLIQVNYGASRKAAELDKDRDMMVKRVGLSGSDNSIYLPTLCIIGSIMHLSSKHKVFDLKDISTAVLKKNELWSRGVDDFNSLFSEIGVRCLKKAVRHPQGRRILNRFLAGLRFVTDLLYESYELKKDGLFEESFDIDDIVSDIGIAHTDAYMLLLSPLHPEHQTLIKFIEDYNSCHDLYLSDTGRWVMVNKRAVKHVNVELLEKYLQALEDGGVSHKSKGEVVAQNTEAMPSTGLDSKLDDIADARETATVEPMLESASEPDEETAAVEPVLESASEPDIDNIIEQSGFEHQKEPDFDDQIEPGFEDREEPDFEDQEEPDYEELNDEDQEGLDGEDQEEGVEDDEAQAKDEGSAKAEVDDELYSARRRRPEIKRPVPIQAEPNQSLFSRPSNAKSVNFDVSDI